MHERSLHEHAQALHRRDYSSAELTRHFLDRIHQHSSLNAFITLTEELALEQAGQADARIARGEADLLTGIPLVHKDLFCTQDILTTCGSRILENFISPYDATVVSRLNQAGMVMLGKTNMDEFAMGSSNENSYFGPVSNPWDHERVPGGSSGGSAAAVAARLAPVATGTDTGGSIRQPAAFCGLTGIKPSYGRVSRFGMIAFASSLDQGGVFAQSAYDAAAVLTAMSGFDDRDSTSLPCAVPDFLSDLKKPLRGLRAGMPKEFFGAGVDPEITRTLEEAVKVLEHLGIRTVEVSLPNCSAAIPCYYVLAPAEASSNLARFDGVRYGHRTASYTDLSDLYETTRSEGFGTEVKRRIMIGTYVLSSGYFDAYYVKAQKLRRLISEDYLRAFEQCDVLIGPTTPTTAFRIGEQSEDPVKMYLNDIFTSSVNLAGLPGLSIPAGFDRNGLPVGLQVIGKYLDEASLLNVGHQFQLHTDWHTRVPGDMA